MFHKWALFVPLVFGLCVNLRAADDAKEISIEGFNAKGGHLRTKNDAAFVDLILTAKDAKDARFRKVAGLADPKGVSFESIQQRGKYLRQRGGRLVLAACASEADKKEATFLVVGGMASAENGWLSLELLAHPGQFLCNKDGNMIAEGKKADVPSKEAGTFRFVEPAAPKKVPSSGKATPGVEALDEVVLKYLEKIGCSAATVTIARGKDLLYSRGYGWSDRYGETPIAPDAPMMIASCDKPVTAAAIRQLALAKKLDLNAKVFELLKIKPEGPVVDERVRAITINHLLDHKAGWQGDPINRAYKAALAKGNKTPIPMETLLGFIMAEKLKDAPGAKAEYSNECYDALRLIVARVSGQSMADYVRHQLCRPLGVAELKGVQLPAEPPVKGEAPPVWNTLNVSVPTAECVCMSTPALCTFMRCFWWTGEPRVNGTPNANIYGLLDNATSIMSWRPDGLNLACVFNGRSNDVKPEDIQKDLDDAIEKLKQEKRIRAK
jgi:CubicO group peptidase (beta-lactamase class C family)